jgi:hypothetical protein
VAGIFEEKGRNSMSPSIIIPSRKVENLKACLSAICEYEPGLPVIVVNDGLSHKPDGPTYIDGVKPFIFSRNVNCGIRAATGDSVVILNDDALLKVPRGFSVMHEQWLANPDFGLIASSVDKCGTPCQHREAESGLRVAPFMVMFACVLLPLSTINLIGLMDERFGANAGTDRPGYGLCDDDMCWRVRRAGLKLGVSDSCFVTHTELQSTFGFREDRKKADIQAHKKLFIEKWGKEPHEWCRQT